MSTATVFNWTKETQGVENFLSSDLGVLHVLGDGQAYASHFVSAIEQAVARASSESDPIVSIDPLNQATSSPLGILQAICRGIGIEVVLSSSAEYQDVSYSILRDLSAGRDLSISNVRVAVPTRSESEELLTLIDRIEKALEDGIVLSGKVVAFRQCHEMDDRQRKTLWASLWKPVLERMIDHGVKFVFLYSPHELDAISDALPPGAHAEIELPTYLEQSDVMDDLVEYVVNSKLEAHGESAFGFAKGIWQTCRTVQDLYERLALAKLRRGTWS